MGKVWFWLKRNIKWRKQYTWCIDFEGKKVYIISFPNLVEPSLDAGSWNWGGDRWGARGHFIIFLLAGIVGEHGRVWRWCCVQCCCNDHLSQQKSTCICFVVFELRLLLNVLVYCSSPRDQLAVVGEQQEGNWISLLKFLSFFLQSHFLTPSCLSLPSLSSSMKQALL